MKKIYFLLIIFGFFYNSAFSQVTQEDFDALVAIYNSTDGTNWAHKDNWNVSTGTKDSVTDQWYGITVSGGRVTEINLPSNNLTGPLPTEIGNLTALFYLNLRWNKIDSIPAEIGQCTALNYISIGNNLFISLPPEIGNLPVLRTLSVIKGPLATIPPEIGNISSLSRFEAYETNITEIPVELGNCTNLDTVVLSSCKLNSVPAEINKLTKLTILDLGYNNISDLPDMSALTKLKLFYVNNNSLDFGDLEATNLTWGGISSTRYFSQSKVALTKSYSPGQTILTCTVSGSNNQYKWYRFNSEIIGETGNSITIPDTGYGSYYCVVTDTNFQDLTLYSITEDVNLTNGVLSKDYDALIALYDSTGGNSWTNRTYWKTDKNVSEWYGITVDSGRIYKISLPNNNLSGAIPSQIGELDKLFYLNLRWNNINNIPAEIGQCSALNYISLGNNLFTQIPPEIGNLPVLRTLSLIESPLESIPSEIGNISSLSRFEAYRTNISELPKELFNCKNMDTLVLSSNEIKSLAPEINQLTKLTILDINSNLLTELPDMSALTNLKTFNVAYNNLDFGDLEAANLEWDSISRKIYSPQNKIGSEQEIISDLGTDVYLVAIVGGLDNIYKWYKGDVEMTDSDNDTLKISGFSVGDKGAYYCSITNENFPDLTLVTDNYYLIVTSFNEPVQDFIKIYPNPSQGKYIIEFEKLSNDNMRIEIMDLRGKIIYNSKIDNYKTDVDIRNNIQGIYILKIMDNKQLYGTYKLIIQK